MDERDVLGGLTDRGVKYACDHPAFPAFLIAMQGRQYGNGPLLSAWAWFSDGWDAASARKVTP